MYKLWKQNWRFIQTLWWLNAETYKMCKTKISTMFFSLKELFLQENCNLVADKYLEYDLINVIIDLILLKIVAIRHFLFNSSYKVGLKIYVCVNFNCHCCRIFGSCHLYCFYLNHIPIGKLVIKNPV